MGIWGTPRTVVCPFQLSRAQGETADQMKVPKMYQFIEKGRNDTFFWFRLRSKVRAYTKQLLIGAGWPSDKNGACDMPEVGFLPQKPIATMWEKKALEVPKTNLQVCVCFLCGARCELCRSSFSFWWKNWGEAHAQVQHYPCWLEAR